MTISSYPHYMINVVDESIYVPVQLDILPIHRPVYAMKSQKGPIGIPVWYDTIQAARKVVGDETFNPVSPYYSQSSYFLNRSFQSNGAFIVRMADQTAETSIRIVELAIKTADIQQYEKDIFGGRTLDSNGDWIPDVVAGQETGVELEWRSRTALEVGEDGITWNPRTVDENGVNVTIYPMFIFKASSPGVWGDDTGFQLFFDKEQNGADKVGRVDSLYYTIGPSIKDFGASTINPVRDKYSNLFSSFVLKPDSIDSAYAMNVSFKDVMERGYDSSTPLPYTIDVIADNIFTAGESIRAVEVNRTDEIIDGWLANIVSLQDLEGRPYDHAIFTTASDVLVKDVVHYLGAGADGDISDTAIESQVQDFMSGNMTPDIVDRARYPFTHVYDTGWSIDTKYSICDFLSVRDDVKIVLSTQTLTDVNGLVTPNTMIQDESVGAALRGRAMLNRESIIKGTGAFRAMIFQQAGIPHDSNKWTAATVWYALKLAEYHNRDYMAQEPAGLPNSDTDIFKEWNWVPASAANRQRGWDTGLNYAQYYSMTRLHYAALRSVYRYDTSVLTIDDFTNALVYTKHEIRQAWAIFSGVTRPNGVLYEQITRELEGRLLRLYNGRYNFEIKVYQTDEEARLGYVHHIQVIVTSPGQNRVWNVDVLVRRSGFIQGN